jgi:hypothetical protein
MYFSRDEFQDLVLFLDARFTEEEQSTEWSEPGSIIPTDCWGPSRVSAELAMKRRILDFQVGLLRKDRAELREAGFAPSEREKQSAMLYLQLMAQMYAYHDDFRASWAL